MYELESNNPQQDFANTIENLLTARQKVLEHVTSLQDFTNSQIDPEKDLLHWQDVDVALAVQRRIAELKSVVEVTKKRAVERKFKLTIDLHMASINFFI